MQIRVNLAPRLSRRAVNLFYPATIFPLDGMTKSVENPFALIVNVLGIPNRDVLTSVETNCVLETECMTEFPVQEIPTVVFVTSKVIWILNVSKDVSIHNAKLLDFTPNTQENKYLFMKEVVY